MANSSTSNAEELPIMSEEKEAVSPKWSLWKKGLLALVAVMVMVNSTLFVVVTANTLIYVRVVALLLTNLFAPPIIDYIGCYGILLLETLIMSASTFMLVLSHRYEPLRAASILQGIGVALTDTSSLVIVAGVFKQKQERIEAIAILWSARYFGKLFLGPVTLLSSIFFDGQIMMAIFAITYVSMAAVLLFRHRAIMKLVKSISKLSKPSVPIWKLIADGTVLVKSGLLLISTELFTLAYFNYGQLQPHWMSDYMHERDWMRVIVWLPTYLAYVLGSILIVLLSKKYTTYLGRIIVLGIILEGVCCYLKRFVKNYMIRMIPISGVAFGVALVDIGLFTSFAKHMEDHYKVSSYAAVYAIANIARSLAFSVSYLVESSILEMMVNVSTKLGRVIESLLNFPFLKRL